MLRAAAFWVFIGVLFFAAAGSVVLQLIQLVRFFM
jgi:hypothetical protein